MRETEHMTVVLPVAKRWFDRTRVDDAITLLWEPHVIALMRCRYQSRASFAVLNRALRAWLHALRGA